MMKNENIRFRVWDGKAFNIIQFDQNPKYWVEYIKDGLDYQQYTGLKDKNGKEIYEGDICRNGDYDNNAHASLYRIEEVKYIEGEARFVGLDYNADGTSCEVIGNIYEQPNLLNKE